MNAKEVDQRTARDWAALAANFGVVIGLVLLTYEVHQANKLAETEAYIDRLDQMQESADEFGESQYLPQIYEKLGGDDGIYGTGYVENLDTLTAIERYRLVSRERGVMLRMSGHYFQSLQGYIDESTGQEVLRDAKRRLYLWKTLGIEIEGHAFKEALEEWNAND
jgi:tetrahydromethanopterin S-methyltransferase subunit G